MTIAIKKLTQSILFIVFVFAFACKSNISNTPNQSDTQTKLNHYEINVRLYPKKNKITAEVIIHLSKDHHGRLSFLINRKLKVETVKVNGKLQPFGFQRVRTRHLKNLIIHIEKVENQNITVVIVYKGVLNIKNNEKHTTAKAIISEKGTYLDAESGWYPILSESLSSYNISIKTPQGYSSISEGRLLSSTSKNDINETKYHSTKPLPGFTLISGKFEVQKTSYRDITIATFFSKKNQSLSATYLEHSKKYLALYEKLLGDYPYSKLYIVESFFQVGYAMPSFTVIGNRVIRLPFIVKTSLGHEILHNWWGNSVYVNQKEGNWCEGLTGYLSDYYFQELKGHKEAKRYRKNISINYTNHVNSKNDFPLKQFENRYDLPTSIIGYGKAMMVFHRLRKLIGDELFFKGLKSLYQDNRFQYLSWSGIQKHFEQISKVDLSNFFQQWVKAKGSPIIKLDKAVYYHDSKLLQLDLSQHKKTYQLIIPIHIVTKKGIIKQTLTLHKSKEKFIIPLKVRPLKLIIDPDYDLFRRLNTEEMPIRFSLFYSDKNKKLIVSRANNIKLGQQLNAALIKGSLSESLLNSGKTLILTQKIEQIKLKKLLKLVKGIELKKHSFSINGKSFNEKDLTLVAIIKNPYSKKGILLIHSLGLELPSSLSRKLPHYQNYSYLVFKGNNVIEKGDFASNDLSFVYNFKPTNQ